MDARNLKKAQEFYDGKKTVKKYEKCMHIKIIGKLYTSLTSYVSCCNTDTNIIATTVGAFATLALSWLPENSAQRRKWKFPKRWHLSSGNNKRKYVMQRNKNKNNKLLRQSNVGPCNVSMAANKLAVEWSMLGCFIYLLRRCTHICICLQAYWCMSTVMLLCVPILWY